MILQTRRRADRGCQSSGFELSWRNYLSWADNFDPFCAASCDKLRPGHDLSRAWCHGCRNAGTERRAHLEHRGLLTGHDPYRHAVTGRTHTVLRHALIARHSHCRFASGHRARNIEFIAAA